MTTNEEFMAALDLIADASLDRGVNPDKLLIAIIRVIYGHNVPIDDLIELIENSPLVED